VNEVLLIDKTRPRIHSHVHPRADLSGSFLFLLLAHVLEGSSSVLVSVVFVCKIYLFCHSILW
jgi:hypothetical protein